MTSADTGQQLRALWRQTKAGHSNKFKHTIANTGMIGKYVVIFATEYSGCVCGILQDIKLTKTGIDVKLISHDGSTITQSIVYDNIDNDGVAIKTQCNIYEIFGFKNQDYPLYFYVSLKMILGSEITSFGKDHLLQQISSRFESQGVIRDNAYIGTFQSIVRTSTGRLYLTHKDENNHSIINDDIDVVLKLDCETIRNSDMNSVVRLGTHQLRF